MQAFSDSDIEVPLWNEAWWQRTRLAWKQHEEKLCATCKAALAVRS